MVILIPSCTGLFLEVGSHVVGEQLHGAAMKKHTTN